MDELFFTKPIGFFDSGIGGITVLAKAIKLLPGERFIYFGDSANAPYGTKEPEDVVKLSISAANFLLGKGIKALVVACNTATSVAVEHLRNTINIPVIGMEPALKPAVEMNQTGMIVVMATPLTLKEKKFKLLMEKYSLKADIVTLPCPGLVELIEAGIWEGVEIHQYLSKIFSGLNSKEISSVVLGCTHYVFIKNEIEKFFDKKVQVIDGNEGTVKQLKRVLISAGLYKEKPCCDRFKEDLVEFYFSGPKDKMLRICDWIKTQIRE